MRTISVSAPASKKNLAVKIDPKSVKNADSGKLARNMKPVDFDALLQMPFLSPKEASNVFAVAGIALSANNIRRRCSLPPSSPEYICRVNSIVGRYYIPRFEMRRILLLEDSPC